MTTGQNKKLYAAIAILVVLCLIASGFYVYIEYYSKEEKTTEVSEKVIDNQISPGVPQAISLEIKRIRVKGIIDHMLNSGSKILTKLGIKDYETYNYLDGIRPGIGWKKKPFFSYYTVLDGYRWEGRPDWNAWDTNYINQEIFRRVKLNQQQTTVEFTIVEKEKKGKKVIETDSDSFSVVYDFRYGNWTGDDYMKDSDGYGHYNGTNYEIWFDLSQDDSDADGIPYWTEVNILGTDPKVDDSKLDPDNDGIPTTWEWKWGYDPFKYDNHTILDPDKDGLQNIEEYKMEKWLANPYHQEIYIEADYTAREPFKPFTLTKKKGKISPIVRLRLDRTTSDLMNHELYEETRQMIMEEYNKNTGITVHIDNGCMGGGGDILPFISGTNTFTQEGGVVSQYYHNNFADDRKGIFRYLVVANGGGWCHPQDYKQWYDTMCIPCNKKFNKNQLNNAQTPRARRIGQAIEFIHEFGHSNGLRGEEWRGVDNRTVGGTVWKNYKSCMNYYWFGLRYFGYSDGSHGENDRNDWATLDLTYFQRPAKDIEGLGW